MKPREEARVPKDSKEKYCRIELQSRLTEFVHLFYQWKPAVKNETSVIYLLRHNDAASRPP